jgi:hypothetical protein
LAEGKQRPELDGSVALLKGLRKRHTHDGRVLKCEWIAQPDICHYRTNGVMGYRNGNEVIRNHTLKFNKLTALLQMPCA